MLRASAPTWVFGSNHAISARISGYSPSLRHGLDDHQFAHQVRVTDGDLHGDPAAHGKAEDIRRTHAQVVDEGGSVVGALLVGQRTVDISRVAMALGLTAIT